MKLRRCRAAEGASRELGDEKHCPFVATDNTFHSSWLYVGDCFVCVCACVFAGPVRAADSPDCRLAPCWRAPAH